MAAVLHMTLRFSKQKKKKNSEILEEVKKQAKYIFDTS